VEMKVTDTVERVIQICDLCKKKKTKRKCLGCGIDLCDECGVWWGLDPWSQTDNGDYPDLVCPSCNNKAQPFVAEVEVLHKELDMRVEELENRWRSSCVKKDES